MTDKKSKKIHPLFIVLIILIIISISLFVIYKNYLTKYNNSLKPIDITSTELIEIEIPQGSTATTISKILMDKGLIRDSNMFKKYIKDENEAANLKAGKFSLSKSMSSSEILEILTAVEIVDKEKGVKLVIPEGYEIKNIADRLEKMGLASKDEFIELTSNKSRFEEDFSFLKELSDGQSLEGFLFPATYEIKKDDTTEDIVRYMLKAYSNIYKKNIEGNISEGMDLNSLMTMASIIEREAKIDEDRPKISSVFYNRLKINMPLQSCATVQYILGERKPVLSIADTQIESPYNTYVNSGLPPAPIANAGLKAINAALNPAETDYLFFVLTGEDGSHTFTKTNAEHEAAKKNMIRP